MSLFLPEGFKSRTTIKQKLAKNKLRQRDLMDYYDMAHNGTGLRDWKKIERHQINYDLFNGKLDIELYDDPVCFSFGGEDVVLDYQNISHYPLISQIANAIVGEQINRPFKPMVKDNTSNRKTYLKKEFNSKIQQYIQQSVLGPKKAEISQRIIKSMGITDLFSLTPEQQKELGQQIDQTVQKETPEEILDFLSNDYQTPTAKQAQKILDHLVEYHDVRWEQIEGFKHAVVTAEEYYYQGERNGQLVFEAVPPTYFRWGGSKETEWCQHGTFAVRERWLTPQEACTRHALEYTEKQLKELEAMAEPMGGSKDWYDWENNQHQKKLMYEYSSNEHLIEKYEGINIKTKEGQSKMVNMYSDIFGGGDRNHSSAEFGVREAHIVWRDKRLLKRIKRLEGNTYKYYYVGENYKATDLDEEVRRIWVDQVWEGYKLGTFDAVYVGIQPVPCQYRSLNNPFNVDLPYVGKKYNSHHGISSSNPSLVDIGKTSQKDFDTIMASIKHDMNTNMGNQFIFFMNLKPEGWKWQDMIDSMRHTSIIPADPHKPGSSPFDAQMIKSVDMTKMADIAGKIQLANQARQSLALTMYFNDARLGAVGQYATNDNTEQNQVASYNQTALFFEQHRKIVEKAMYSFINTARHYYKKDENLEKAELFLDDVSLAELKTGPYSSYRELGITLSNSGAELQKLNILKQQMLGFIQNGASPESVMRLIFADTEGEVKEIIKKESERLEQQRQESMAAQQQQSQLVAETELKKEQIRQDREDKREANKLRSQEKRAEIEVHKFKLANDVNENKLSDLIEKAAMDNETKILLKEMELGEEVEKRKLKEKLNEKF